MEVGPMKNQSISESRIDETNHRQRKFSLFMKKS